MNLNFNDKRVKGRSRLLIQLTISFSVTCATLQAGAATLDAKAEKSLTSNLKWQIKTPGGTIAIWSWRSDGSVCARAEGKNSESADSGTWKIDGKRLCYELTWLGGTGGFKSNCFRVVDHGRGRYRYEALSDNGLPFVSFRSLNS